MMVPPPAAGTNKRQRTSEPSAAQPKGTADFMVLHHTLAATSSDTELPVAWVWRTLNLDAATSGTGTTDTICNGGTASLHGKEEYNGPLDIQQAISSAKQQLAQVKERLGPASQVAATAKVCARGPDTHTHHTTTATTTPQAQFQNARQVTNPAEVLDYTLGRQFLNRSALKLANIDAALNFTLIPHQSLVQLEETFVFVDLCGAPGGFSEYILERVLQYGIPVTYGYGLSLLGTNENGHGLAWKLHDHHNRRVDRSTTHYRIVTGPDGTGDIYQWSSVQDLIRQMEHDHGRGAHLVTADGGFDAQRNVPDQEGIAQKLVVCQVAAALACLRPGGTLVLKGFGCQTLVIRCLIQELVQAFSHLQWIKPISSRPASAERYLVATGFVGLPPHWDGPSWCNSVFLGKTVVLPSPQVASFLDHMDYEMLQLNLKACYAILSYLQQQQQQQQQTGTLSSSLLSSSIQEEEDAYEMPIQRLRRAWSL